MSTTALSSSSLSSAEITQLMNKKRNSALLHTVNCIMYLGIQILLFDSFTASSTALFTIGASFGSTILAGLAFSVVGYIFIASGLNALTNISNLIGYWSSKNVELLKMEN